MIDSITIISKGGLVLYQFNQTTDENDKTNNAINRLVSEILLDPTKSSQRRYIHSSTVAEWKDGKDFVVVVLYPEVVLRGSKSTKWLSVLLDSVIGEYTIFNDANDEVVPDTSLFHDIFQILWKEALKEKDSFSKNIEPLNGNKEPLQRSRVQKNKGKEKRFWGEAKVTKEAMAELDFSKEPQGSSLDENSIALKEARAAYLPTSDEAPAWDEVENLDDEAQDDSGWGSSLKGFLDQMSGNKVLSDNDLDQPLQDLQQQLTSKNVASDIASEICQSVRSKLVGKRMQSFSRVKTAVRQALEIVVSKILAPKKAREVDPLRGVVSKRGGGLLSAKKGKKPFCITFIGINGVGKSTSLAKVAYYLKSNGCSPMLAACDTFRSGAVEQLNVHADCLEVPLYHKGYAKDPSAVANAAIAHASDQGHDVVLIDTAGRMQNNVPLMKALSKLVVENEPDLVLFVCEALVGNDGIDQLNMFNKALRSGGHVRQIDGIILTKFDTVSDKVGAALTMTHVTGAPVVFVGTGQKYTHLKKLSVQAVIKSLFS
mmetsp:Transcript_12546/g.18429  ORF Transcript_12546/g.18429 Transcript_12546/m.18429 type:complete len:542 (+) Transcript_12546:141-1766(+)|eukprot:CAMPEP_0194216070 /NCGR_PEP_ID=MMETSP0156-20130528/18245_1 /TAXON_ID=33649 /ORGANISM="Thalassionema nitzschioides, Strain L26-B" /LENGTH=541 /DNA_ID=CAMNT_0038944743 /DNA_START=70 /DNA_END=1695 /DNA_ORIENTATION=-